MVLVLTAWIVLGASTSEMTPPQVSPPSLETQIQVVDHGAGDLDLAVVSEQVAAVEQAWRSVFGSSAQQIP